MDRLSRPIQSALGAFETTRNHALRSMQTTLMYDSTIGELLDTFAMLRRQNLADLAALHLTEAQLDLEGMHPALGRVTLRQLLSTWVAHDLNHLHQIAKAMAYQYQEQVGPWRAYLSILPQTG